MSEEYMLCNFKNCNTPLTKTAWVTRCSHVFCDKHGTKHFCSIEAKIKCPACCEPRNRETDIFKADLSTTDMLISCVRPDKALEYASRAAKLWCYQMQIKRKLNLGSMSSNYEKMVSETVLKYQLENNELKKHLMNVEKMLKLVNDELESTKLRLQKYKAAYESSLSTKVNTHLRHQHMNNYKQKLLRRHDQQNQHTSNLHFQTASDSIHQRENTSTGFNFRFL